MRTLIQALKTKELRKKIFFVIFLIIIFRVGSFIPTPGVDYKAVHSCVAAATQENFVGLVNLFSGGALLQLSIFALGIMPYITASIIIQLLRVVIPRFDDLHKEGQTGQTKLTQYTRYLTIFLGILQSTTMISLARSGNLFAGCSEKVIPSNSVWTFLLMMIVMTAGTGVIMWLGELITERGIGNGMSLLIFTSITARMPSQLLTIGQSGKWGAVFAIICLMLLVSIVVVYLEQAQRRIPVQYAKRMIGRRQYGGTTTYIPLKINMSGVIPVIFASSLLAFPPMLAQFGSQDSKWVQWISANFHQDAWPYLTAGALYLVIVALIPSLAIIPLHISQGQMPFGGTTLLIIIGGGLQTVKEINTQLQQHHYEGFLR